MVNGDVLDCTLKKIVKMLNFMLFIFTKVKYSLNIN